MKYQCLFCKKEFDKKYNYDRHRLHVKYCVENKIINNEKPKEKREKCEDCKKTFKNKYTLERHKLKNCQFSNTPVIDTSNIGKIEEKEEFEKIINKTIKNMNKDFLVANITINNYQNSKIINNYNNVNAFGKEDVSYITEEVIKNIFNNPSSSVIKMIKEIHFNEEHPQNMNVRQTNKKINLIDLFNGVDWEKHNKEEVIHNLIASKKDILDDAIEKMNIEKIKKEQYAKLSTDLDNALYKSLLPNAPIKYNKIDTKILKPISNGIHHFLQNRKEIM